MEHLFAEIKGSSLSLPNSPFSYTLNYTLALCKLGEIISTLPWFAKHIFTPTISICKYHKTAICVNAACYSKSSKELYKRSKIDLFCAKIVGRDRPTSSVAKLHLFFILSFFCAILPSLDWFLTEMLEATGLPLNCITLSLSGSLTDAPFYIFWESLMHSYIERKILEITAINIISLHYMHTVSL